MLRATLRALLAPLVCAAGACQSGRVPQLPPTLAWPPPDRRVELWREDLAHLARELTERHVAPFRVISRDDFERSVARLNGDIPALDDDGVVIEMARLAASIGDGHTGILLHSARIGLAPGPLWLVAFEDGIFVKGVAGEQASGVLNLELTSVGGVPADEALRRVAPLVMRDNDMGLLLVGPGYLNLPRVLQSVGLSDEPDAATYVFANDAGEEVELRCSALAPETPRVFAVRYAPGSPGAPLAERLRSAPYAFERLEDVALLQYNACRDDPAESFAAFCDRVFADLDRDPPRALVVDLRWNTGGHSGVSRPLYRELRRRPHLTRDGRLRVLIGRGTFSSGLWAAVDLARDFDAVLYGEPTSGTPNAPGERGVIVLPHSTLDCGYSRRMWRRGGDVFPGPALEPDVLVRETSEQHFAGRDPILEAALADRP